MRTKRTDSIRLNTSPACGFILREIQAEYHKKFHPATITLPKLADLAIVYGKQAVRQKLGLPG